MPAAAQRFEFAPPPQPGLGRALGLAMVAHLLLRLGFGGFFLLLPLFLVVQPFFIGQCFFLGFGLALLFVQRSALFLAFDRDSCLAWRRRRGRRWFGDRCRRWWWGLLQGRCRLLGLRRPQFGLGAECARFVFPGHAPSEGRQQKQVGESCKAERSSQARLRGRRELEALGSGGHVGSGAQRGVRAQVAPTVPRVALGRAVGRPSRVPPSHT